MEVKQTAHRHEDDRRGGGHTPVDVQLSVVGQVVVDDQRNLRDVQASSPHVCRDQDPAETQEGGERERERVRSPDTKRSGPTRAVTRSLCVTWLRI